MARTVRAEDGFDFSSGVVSESERDFNLDLISGHSEHQIKKTLKQHGGLKLQSDAVSREFKLSSDSELLVTEQTAAAVKKAQNILSGLASSRQSIVQGLSSFRKAISAEISSSYKLYEYNLDNLSFTLKIYQNEEGNFIAEFNITQGYMDINALWFSNGDTTVDGDTSLSPGDSNLNMFGSSLNGQPVVWDDYLKLSSPGLGPSGTNKETYIQVGETKTFELTDLPAGINLDYFSIVGIRATTTSTPEGSIKTVDQGEIKELTSTADRTATATPTGDRTATVTVTATATPTGDRTATPTADRTATPTGDRTATPTGDRTVTPTADRTATPTADRTATPTSDRTATPTADRTATPTADRTATATVTATATPTGDRTATPTADRTATPTADRTATPTGDRTATPTDDRTATPTADRTATPTGDRTATATATLMPTKSVSVTVSTTVSGSNGGTPTPSSSVTPKSIVETHSPTCDCTCCSPTLTTSVTPSVTESESRTATSVSLTITSTGTSIPAVEDEHGYEYKQEFERRERQGVIQAQNTRTLTSSVSKVVSFTPRFAHDPSCCQPCCKPVDPPIPVPVPVYQPASSPVPQAAPVPQSAPLVPESQPQVVPNVPKIDQSNSKKGLLGLLALLALLALSLSSSCCAFAALVIARRKRRRDDDCDERVGPPVHIGTTWWHTLVPVIVQRWFPSVFCEPVEHCVEPPSFCDIENQVEEVPDVGNPYAANCAPVYPGDEIVYGVPRQRMFSSTAADVIHGSADGVRLPAVFAAPTPGQGLDSARMPFARGPLSYAAMPSVSPRGGNIMQPILPPLPPPQLPQGLSGFNGEIKMPSPTTGISPVLAPPSPRGALDLPDVVGLVAKP